MIAIPERAGLLETSESIQAAVEAQSLEATAAAHAEAQAHNMAHAQNLAAKAHAHAQQAHTAQAQAQVKAVHAHSLQARPHKIPQPLMFLWEFLSMCACDTQCCTSSLSVHREYQHISSVLCCEAY